MLTMMYVHFRDESRTIKALKNVDRALSSTNEALNIGPILNQKFEMMGAGMSLASLVNFRGKSKTI